MTEAQGASQDVSSPKFIKTVIATEATTLACLVRELESNFPSRAKMHQNVEAQLTPRDAEIYVYANASDDVESRENYRIGGYHPTHLGDIFDDGRYKIVHKLGWGGFSTVWLAHDSVDEKYVALKIFTADAYITGHERDIKMYSMLTDLCADKNQDHTPGRQYMDLLLRHFEFVGPNGKHLCLVFEVNGPSAKSLCSTRLCSLTPYGAREISWQIGQALHFLHSNNICHGDLTTGNIVLQIKDITKFTEDQLYDVMGIPVIESIEMFHDIPKSLSAPRYMVQPIDFRGTANQLIIPEIKLIDLGQAYHVSEAAEQATKLGIPLPYMAPDIFMFCEAGPAADIWAYACAIFELRAGRNLFELYLSYNPEALLSTIIKTLGPLPESWTYCYSSEEDMSVQEDGAKPEFLRKYTDDEILPFILESQVMKIRDEYMEGDDSDTEYQVLHLPPRPDTPIEITSTWAERPTRWIEDKEALTLADLLRRMLAYRAEMRPTSLEFLAWPHPWFTGKEPLILVEEEQEVSSDELRKDDSSQKCELGRGVDESDEDNGEDTGIAKGTHPEGERNKGTEKESEQNEEKLEQNDKEDARKLADFQSSEEDKCTETKDAGTKTNNEIAASSPPQYEDTFVDLESQSGKKLGWSIMSSMSLFFKRLWHSLWPPMKIPMEDGLAAEQVKNPRTRAYRFSGCFGM